MIRNIVLALLLIAAPAHAASIWSSTAVTPSSTDRIPVDVSAAGAPSHVTPLTLKAYMETGGTVTADDPILDLSQTWNNAAVTFTGAKVNITNTASAAASKPFDVQVGGATVFSVRADGAQVTNNYGLLYTGGYLVPTDTAFVNAANFRASSIGFSAKMFFGAGGATSGPGFLASANETGGLSLVSSTNTAYAPIAVSTVAIYGTGTAATARALLEVPAGDILEQRRTTNAQTFRVYDTYTDASNYGRLALNTSLTGDWVQIAAETAGTAGNNYGIALTPTGTGAISAHVPDSTVTGGNARGSNAVDWQVLRADVGATAVASGNSSFLGGGNSNTAAGGLSVVAGGYQNSASATESTVSGGRLNSASGTRSWVPGGAQATTRGLTGAGAYSSGQRAALGDAQVILQPVRRTTTDATPVSLATDGTPAATTVMVLPASSTLMCTAMVVAQSAAAANNAGYEIKAVIQRDGSNATALVGAATTTTVAEDTAGMDATIIANDTLESAEIQVTGVAATTIYWVGELKCVQVL